MSDLEQRLAEAGGKLVRLGALEFPSGRIVASDPYSADDSTPFERTVTPGKYEIEIGRVNVDPFGWRCLFARLRISDEPATHYELAVAEDGDDGFFVDAGLASFMDEQARDAFYAAMERFDTSHPGANYHRERLLPDMDKTKTAEDETTHGWWAFHQPEGTEVQIAVFTSGLGDNRYETFWGLTKTGNPASLVIDFRVV